MTSICAQIAGVLLVDSAGRLLLQLRDGNTRIDPHRWCLPGGDIEPGEDPMSAAARELLEETSLKPDGDLTLYFHGVLPSARFPGAMAEYFIYSAPTLARQDDVECHEGAAMLFRAPEDIAGLEFGNAYSQIIPRFLNSPEYWQLASTVTSPTE